MTKQPAIPTRGCYPGAILEEGQTSIEEFNRATGFRHPIFMTFLSFPEVLDPRKPDHGKATRFLDACRRNDAIPAITIETFGGLNSYTPAQVAEFARFLDSFGRPMILRWNHEMNGSWYPWGQQPALYIQRFREFADVIHQCAPGIAMAWTPNQGWGYPWPGCPHFSAAVAPGDPYTPYYPGDEYVDWVGISFYHWGEDRGANQAPPPGKWGQANGIGNHVPNFHDVFAVGHNKPMMIAETSALFDTGDSRGGGASEEAIKTAWLRQVYNTSDESQPRLDTSFPQLKAIFWFNILKYESEVKGDVDWRLNGNQSSVERYSQLLANKYFVTFGGTGEGQKKSSAVRSSA